MKKILLILLCLTAFVMAGCGDKYAKEKEAITKAEKAAMAMELPIVERPDFSKMPKPTNEERKNIWKKYNEDFSNFVATEEKILEEMRKSDDQIAELEKKAESDSDKKNLKEFKDKLRKDRIKFVKKVSKGRLYGDTFIVGVGSTWQEVEMVYGKPKDGGKQKSGFREYAYDGLAFNDWIGGGAYPPGHPKLVNWRSTQVQAMIVTRNDITSEAGVRVGMTVDEMLKVLKAKYAMKNTPERDEMYVGRSKNPSANEAFEILGFAMRDTRPYNIFVSIKDGKLVRYAVAPH